MSTQSAIQEDEATFEAEDTEQPIPPTDIVAYNELRSCADLVRLHTSGKLEIQPDFQRDVVWKNDEQSRFIDSLVKQLPIPSMCFSLDHKTQRWKVIDGLQRMSTIIRFLSSSNWELSDLPDILPNLRKTKNSALREGSEDQRRIYSLVEDVSIPVTVIRCDYTQQSHMRYLFTIFHRLNSGGVRLTNQEIRNCIFTGSFNNFLKTFDRENAAWKAVRRRIWGGMDRFRSVEVLLRVLAFGDEWASYDGNLARFLNDYMNSHVNESSGEIETRTHALESVMTTATLVFGSETRRKMPLLLVEAVLVALYANRNHGAKYSEEALQSRYLVLKTQPSVAANARYAVSSVENVRARMKEAIAAFA